MGCMPLEFDEVHLWWCHATCPTLAEQAQLEPQERLLADRFVHRLDRDRYLAMRWLARRVLSRYAAVEPADWRFSSQDLGKPMVAWPRLDPMLHFNLSHSACVVLIGVGRQALGVDIESHCPPNPETLAPGVFSPEELRWWRAGSPAGRLGDFLRLWTLKEALVKALGLGMHAPLTELVLRPGERSAHEHVLVQAPAWLEPAPQAWHLQTGWLDPSQPWALAMRCRNPRVRGPWPANGPCPGG